MSFATQLLSFANISALNADRLVREVVSDIAEELVDRSPVGDPSTWAHPNSAPKDYKPGHFKANWHHSMGAPGSEERPIEDPSGEVSMDQINSSVSSVSDPLGVHCLYNNVSYAMALENGHSDQAPNGMVALTVLDAPAIVDRAVSRLRI